MLRELRDRDVLHRDAVARVGCNHGIAMAVIVRGHQQRLEIGKDGVIDGDHIRVDFEVGNRVVTEVGLEHERIVAGARDQHVVSAAALERVIAVQCQSDELVAVGRQRGGRIGRVLATDPDVGLGGG